MLGLDIAALGKLAGLAAATGGMVVGGIQNVDLKDVGDLGGKIAEAFKGEKQVALFSSFARRVEAEVQRVIAERARSPRNRAPEIVAQNLHCALERFAIALDKLHVSQLDFVASDLDRMKVAERLLDKLAALEPCFREGDENREARPLASELLRRSFEVATLDKGFLDSLLSAADAELLRRTTGLAIDLKAIGSEIQSGFSAQSMRFDALEALIKSQFQPADRDAITAEVLEPIVRELALAHVPEAEWAFQIIHSVRDLLAKQSEAVAPSNLGSDIDAAIWAARAAVPNVNRAVDILRDRRAQIRAERYARQRAEAALLKEEADFLRLSYRHRQAVAILQEASELDLDDPWLLFARGDLHIVLGESMQAVRLFRRGCDIAERIGHARDLSSGLERTGDVLREQGDLEGALKSYRASHAIAEGIASDDAEDPVLQRDLSVSLNKIGDVLLLQGDLAASLHSFEKGLAIIERLVLRNADHLQWQYDLSVSLERIGDVRLSEDDKAGSLESYRKAHAIRERLAAQEPGILKWQGGLCVSFTKVGDVLGFQSELQEALQNHRAGFSIAERLTETDPSNVEWQISLAASGERIGDILCFMKDFAAALSSHEGAHSIRARLCEGDPANAQRRRSLSVSIEKIGDVQLAEGKRTAAQKSYRDVLAIVEKLARDDPSNADGQRDLIVVYAKIAQAGDDACGAWSTAHLVARTLAEQGRLAPADLWMIEDTAKHRDRSCSG